MKNAFGNKLTETLIDFFNNSDSSNDISTIIYTVKSIYYKTLEYVDNIPITTSGTTMSLGIFDKENRKGISQLKAEATIVLDQAMETLLMVLKFLHLMT